MLGEFGLFVRSDAFLHLKRRVVLATCIKAPWKPSWEVPKLRLPEWLLWFRDLYRMKILQLKVSTVMGQICSRRGSWGDQSPLPSQGLRSGSVKLGTDMQDRNVREEYLL